MAIKNLAVALAFALPAIARPADFTPQIAHIVGGVPANEGDFPYIVSLQRISGGSHFCGGSLLNENTVLSAAHCASGQNPTTIQIRAGSLDRTTGGVVAKIASIKIHPNFSSSTLDSDVSIWKLATPIPANGTIGFATLPVAGSDPTPGELTTTAGWGTTSSGGGSLPTKLLKVDVPIVARTECRANYTDIGPVTETMICASFPEGGKDSCQGDSGGPIVDQAKTLIGTVSWGQGCALPGKPGVYGRVSALLDFINANL